jgi:hypothetical protein
LHNPRFSIGTLCRREVQILLDYGRAVFDDRRMDTIEEYKIIESEDFGSLAEEVNAALKEGWQPHGAPLVHLVADIPVCCQAMVKSRQPAGGERIAALRR